MESTIAASTQPQVTVGVDTHKQFHGSPPQVRPRAVESGSNR
jgi:hypothetical protein